MLETKKLKLISTLFVLKNKRLYISVSDAANKLAITEDHFIDICVRFAEEQEVIEAFDQVLVLYTYKTKNNVEELVIDYFFYKALFNTLARFGLDERIRTAANNHLFTLLTLGSDKEILLSASKQLLAGSDGLKILSKPDLVKQITDYHDLLHANLP